LRFSSATSSARRFVAVAVAGLALLTMSGPAVAADGGYASVGRAFKMTGDRDRLAVVAKVTRPAAGSGLAVGVELGTVENSSAGSISVVFTQGTGKAASRGIKVDGFSTSYKAVQGANCSYDMRLVCDRQSYDWVAGRAYKVTFVRGAKNAQGWLWTVRLRDQKTAKVVKLVSFRSPARQLASNGEAALYTNPRDCSNITPVAGVVKKPTGAGSSISWGAVSDYSSCDGATMAAPIVKGSARLRIS
jgi:hypothetical protein